MAGVEPEAHTSDGAATGKRKWIGVRFDCCGAYARIYRNPAGTAYEGRCPRCLKPVRAAIGTGGTDCRFFVAD
ncbi:MAG: hypothetical protein H6817_10765 [Phycisphaerales bacterium]|nr:hypothetical protein [Phycisphaerales bacterium]